MFNKVVKAVGDFFHEMRMGAEDAPIETAIYVGFLLTIATVLIWQEFFMY